MPKSDTQGTGDCFEAAYMFVTSRSQGAPGRYTLVHGNVATLSQRDSVNHAWVEEGDIVHEVSKGRHLQFLKTRYYELYGVKNVRQYSYEEALNVALRTLHYGPWDEIGRDSESTA